MLDAIRKRSGSIVVNVLLVLLAVSFGIWGVGDYVRRGGVEQVVATVGDRDISVIEYRNQYQRELVRLRRFFGEGLTPDAARALGIPQSVVRQMINTELLNAAADEAGFRVDDKTVAEAIHGMQQFAGLTGGFDRQRFAEVLQSGGYSEAAFIELVRGELERQALTTGLIGNPPVARELSHRLFRYTAETRDGEYFVVPETALSAPATPDEATIAGYFDEHADSFVAPAYRKVTYVALTPDAVADEIEVSEQDILVAYDARAADFMGKARRQVAQMIFSDRVQADAALERARSGEDFTALAGELAGQSPETTALGWVNRDDLLPGLGDAVFEAGKGDVIGPLESAIGWHVFLVTDAEDAVVKPLDDVRAELKQAIVHERSLDRLFELANTFDEMLGSGASLEDAARDLNLEARTIDAIDDRGRGADGEAVEGLPDPAFAGNVFAEEVGLESPLIEYGNGYYAIRVEGENESRPRTLDEVRDDIVAELQRLDRVAQAKDIADDIAGRVNAGASLADAVVAAIPNDGSAIAVLEGVTRDGGGLAETAPRVAIGPLFGVASGKAGVAAVGDSFVVVGVTGIKVPEAVEGSSALDTLEAGLMSDAQADLNSQLLDGLSRSIGVDVNEAALRQSDY